ncbi:hypothetical protein A9Q84_10245 [Halobacteriovorax marinus]|uniref:Methyltransferase domain-containing protein n=1 Tax=Halobacteriovorax marinus TaxID=97084 RepID=A0A1Y5F744_9BACT|nr:hypothetical protein A9Q84_10245 [Halobacteriovorax marinus]
MTSVAKNELKDHLIWKHWDLPYSRHSEEILKIINVKEGDKVLDCAIGEGRYAIPMAAQGADVQGVDNSDFIIERLSKKISGKGLKITVKKQDLRERLDFDDNVFDISATLGTMVHIDKFEHVCEEFYRITKPGGRIIVEFTNKWHITSLLEKLYQVIDLKFRSKKFDNRVPIYLRSMSTAKKPFLDKDCTIKTYGFYPILPNAFPIVGTKLGIIQKIPGLSYGLKKLSFLNNFCQIGILEITKK